MRRELSSTEVLELSNRLARGDRGALSSLFEAFAGLALANVIRVLKNRAEAEEVVQETFLEVWRRAAHYQPERAAFVTWLLTIARTRAIDRLRANEAQARARAGLEREPTEVGVLTDVADGPKLRECLAALSGDQRHALELAYFEGLSQSQIAAQTGAPLGTVKTRTRQGLLKLSKLLGVSPDAA